MNNVKLRDIINLYGTPNYVFFQDEFRQNLRELEEAYRTVYPRFQIAYSFKTNYMPSACKEALRQRAYAEVVSDLEYHIAKKYGYSPKKIIVNGPGKWNGLQEMLSDGALVMLDNCYEADEVKRIAEKIDNSVFIGFRLNFSVGTAKESRFGFDADAEETKETIAQMRKTRNIKIIGIHFHLGGSRGIEAWKARSQKMIQYAEELLEKEERVIIDLGSGMFGHLKAELAAQFNQKIPSFNEYAQIVGGEFQKKFGSLSESEQPLLVVEPGATVIANTMVYMTRVIAQKNIRGRRLLMVDGSVHQLGELGKKKQLPVTVLPFSKTNKRIVNADVTGYTCLEDDILYKALDKEVGVGDILVFDNVGAYTNVMKPPFIQAGCGIVTIDHDKFHLEKRAETIEDFLITYQQGEA